MEKYEERLCAEREELQSRIFKLENMLKNYGTQTFKPECTYTQLSLQCHSMKMYLQALDERNDMRRIKSMLEEEEKTSCDD